MARRRKVGEDQHYRSLYFGDVVSIQYRYAENPLCRVVQELPAPEHKHRRFRRRHLRLEVLEAGTPNYQWWSPVNPGEIVTEEGYYLLYQCKWDDYIDRGL